MAVQIKEVKTKKDLKTFIYLPEKIHKNHKNWLPPIYLDEFQYFNPKKNKLFDHADTILLLAFKNGEPVGRIMGVINKKYNEIHNEKDGRFAFMECYEDEEVFHALITAVEQWAKQKGCENLVGPLAFSDKDPQGFMIEGFEHPPIIAINTNLPYMPKLLEKENYVKKVDLVNHLIPVPKKIPNFYQEIYNRVLKNNPNLKIIEFQSKKELKPYIKPVLRLLNETFKDIYAFVPLDDYEMEDFAKRYLPILHPEFIKVVEDQNNTPIAFIIGIPEPSPGIQKAKGRLFPFGIFHIIKAMKKSKQITLLLGGVKEEYRKKGLDVVLGYHMLKSAIKNGFEYVDSHLQLENNILARREMERMGGKIIRRFRIYTKPLS